MDRETYNAMRIVLEYAIASRRTIHDGEKQSLEHSIDWLRMELTMEDIAERERVLKLNVTSRK